MHAHTTTNGAPAMNGHKYVTAPHPRTGSRLTFAGNVVRTEPDGTSALYYSCLHKHSSAALANKCAVAKVREIIDGEYRKEAAERHAVRVADAKAHPEVRVVATLSRDRARRLIADLVTALADSTDDVTLRADITAGTPEVWGDIHERMLALSVVNHGSMAATAYITHRATLSDV